MNTEYINKVIIHLYFTEEKSKYKLQYNLVNYHTLKIGKIWVNFISATLSYCHRTMTNAMDYCVPALDMDIKQAYKKHNFRILFLRPCHIVIGQCQMQWTFKIFCSSYGYRYKAWIQETEWVFKCHFEMH